MTTIEQKTHPDQAVKITRGSTGLQAKVQMLNESQLLQPINEMKKASLDAK